MRWLKLAAWGVAAAVIAIMLFTRTHRPEPEHVYSFVLPHFMPACFEYQPLDGEQLMDWDLQQPTMIHIIGHRQVTIFSGRFTPCPQRAMFYLEQRTYHIEGGG